MTKKCETCKFSVFKENRERGMCRRYPPTTATHYNDGFPAILRSDWCGEWGRAKYFYEAAAVSHLTVPDD